VACRRDRCTLLMSLILPTSLQSAFVKTQAGTLRRRLQTFVVTLFYPLRLGDQAGGFEMGPSAVIVPIVAPVWFSKAPACRKLHLPDGPVPALIGVGRADI